MVWRDENFLFRIEPILSCPKTKSVSTGWSHCTHYQFGHSVFKTKIWWLFHHMACCILMVTSETPSLHVIFSWGTSKGVCFQRVFQIYIGCPIISETALRMNKERDLSANHGTTHIPQSITDTTSHQWNLYVQMRPRYSWLPKMCWRYPFRNVDHHFIPHVHGVPTKQWHE